MWHSRRRDIERLHGLSGAGRHPHDVFGAGGPFGPDGVFGPEGPFGRGGPFGSGGGHDGPRRRRRVFGQGELRLALLRLLADTPRHGYELIKAIEEMTGGAYAPSPGAVYPTLQLLADEGAVVERQADDGTRKTYSMTEQGLDELAGNAAEVSALMSRLAGLAEEQRSHPHRQINRAMTNLRNALRMQRQADALSGETLNAVVDLIDDTARRIERL